MSRNEEFYQYSKELLEKNHENDQSNVNHLFNSNDFISKPIKSKKCTIDENIIQLQYPYLNKNKFDH